MIGHIYFNQTVPFEFLTWEMDTYSTQDTMEMDMLLRQVEEYCNMDLKS